MKAARTASNAVQMICTPTPTPVGCDSRNQPAPKRIQIAAVTAVTLEKAYSGRRWNRSAWTRRVRRSLMTHS